MEFEIRVVYLGAYQEYKIATYGKEGGTEITGFAFVVDNQGLIFHLKDIKLFKVYPTIREAMINACNYDPLYGTHYGADSDFDHFEVNGHEITDLEFLNFI